MIYSIQYLRGLAALLVLLQHVATKGAQYSSGPLDFLLIGGAGVDLFFIISGFIMCEVTSKSLIRPVDFMVARFLRIIPLYWALSTVALIVYLYSPELVNRSGGHTSVWASYLLWPTGDKYLINNGWTLSYEFIFYIIFCFSLLVNKARVVWSVLSAIIVIVCIGQAIDFENPALAFSTAPILLEFCLGVLAFELRRIGLLTRSVGYTSLMIGVGALVAINAFRVDGYYQRHIYYGLPCFFLTIGLVAFEDLIKKSPSRFLSMLGDSSYSMYLTHGFVLAGLSLVLNRVYDIPRKFPVTFSVVLTLAAIWVGFLCFRWVEKPIDRRLREWRSKCI